MRAFQQVLLFFVSYNFFDILLYFVVPLIITCRNFCSFLFISCKILNKNFIKLCCRWRFADGSFLLLRD